MAPSLFTQDLNYPLVNTNILLPFECLQKFSEALKKAPVLLAKRLISLQPNNIVIQWFHRFQNFLRLSQNDSNPFTQMFIFIQAKKTLLLPRVYKLSITFSKWLHAFYPISHISKPPNQLQNISRPLNNSFFPYYWSTLMLWFLFTAFKYFKTFLKIAPGLLPNLPYRCWPTTLFYSHFTGLKPEIHFKYLQAIKQ